MLTNFKKADTEPGKPSGPPPAAPVSRPAAAAPKRGSERNPPSVIGPDLTINGNMVSKGEVQIDGEIQGDLHGTHVIVGERARITGGIVAEEVVVRGHVMGSIRGKRVMLQAQSHVEGDIYHQALAIEQGAFFEGKSRRSEDPISDGGKAEAPPMAARSASPPSPSAPSPAVPPPAAEH